MQPVAGRMNKTNVIPSSNYRTQDLTYVTRQIQSAFWSIKMWRTALVICLLAAGCQRHSDEEYNAAQTKAEVFKNKYLETGAVH